MISLIGIVGGQGSGKTVVARTFARYGYNYMPIGEPMDRMFSYFLSTHGVPGEVASRCITGDLRDTAQPALGGKTVRESRRLMKQSWGEAQGEAFWIEALKTRIADHDLTVTDDVESAAEADAVRAMGGKLVLVTRPGITSIEVTPDFTYANLGTLDDMEAWAADLAQSERGADYEDRMKAQEAALHNSPVLMRGRMRS